MKNVLLGAAVAAAMLPGLANADEGKWYINPAVGYQIFDGDRDLDESATALLGVEKEINNNWGVEVRATFADADHYRGNQRRDAEAAGINLDVLRYYKHADSKWVPYSAFGIGHAEINPETGASDVYTQMNLGGGVRYLLDDNWSIRGDARYFYGNDNETSDGIFSIGVSYAFGGSPAPAPAPAAPTDSDADGVADGVDQCPNTPAGVAVDARGCALDKDGDGVPNYRDKCPNTPAGRQVDKFGCKFVLKQTESIKLEINFPLDSDAIPAAYRGELEKVASFMKKFGGVKAVVEGHADSTGAAAYNKQLSQRRADAVRNALVRDYGIASDRLAAVGYGEERPIASNSTSEGRRANRRVVAVMEAETVK
ncbi:outer membrane protein/peptidoglycan-associated (lipo)protein [Spongiibacter sp. IMCC21906]|uniref:OmpA family protein n=1 Tax=Spongiibacter sp. IMCC21906 TaxID=1620392 RepID=UPI00062DE902|nr:OmpA family protein [Spongiibacter sp. IMCC21906]AKH69114.1 outer membrane protein/peptidoglycan-associated (lipo)protein [Spongiibacter sp. IMCC21906]